ncbi:nicotinate-nucleotide--dimethylbenzimidazole phosphoribosyltransferase [Galbibacter mesophilus]|uniref:nicotinate-nucleotide--dimethylbenzimidazole phosphoribosyltransferase n=1 Tax=Galbibacter mesophilus TaxID=379069 RepID=UPI0019200741|nr:nicotinate-nucleotide--dimethylbenzimidazole phosphoribosyltransferase [Galbibacter mesophilus]MCM5663747.1 nicotinate-nucleotide--dimethylbenzimidazole phosphoribosyltransferase [Galbibacter mesophilus]
MNIENQLQQKIDTKTKPIGALGMLEKLAFKIGTIQSSLSPKLTAPTMIVFAGDHGIANHGVSAYPQEVTHQMVLNFLNGGAAINVFSKQHDIELKIVDAGVNFDFPSNDTLISAKIANGTQSFLEEKAMTAAQFQDSIEKGASIVKEIAQSGTNIIGFGEMGIGNTSSSAIIMSYLCNIPIEDCVGKGTGVEGDQLSNKINILKKTKDFHGTITSPEEVLTTFGGFEMVQMYGAMLEAQRQGMIILVDGFIASTVFLAAYKTNPSIQKNAIFCHLSDESGHLRLLNYLNAEPILKLNMRLGEGTGCALAYPLIKSAVAFLNEMASFESASVSEKSQTEAS